MKEGEIVEFIRTKDFKFIKEIGQGGTGRTVLLEDELIDERFVCKKYSPYDIQHQETYYNNFKDEIKLLHLLFHRNIVRVFNYYLYPEFSTGYILMEYVEGSSISDYLSSNADRLDDIFIQVINAFKHLEENTILHRDIRPENILVSSNGIVKIIDFGFGKKIEFDTTFDNSISLNWRYNQPNDFSNKIYDYKTELYFVGKLFEEIIIENNLQNFSYMSLLGKMTQFEHIDRINSFFDIYREIITDGSKLIDFTESEQEIYLAFANNIPCIYSKIESNTQYISNIESIITELENVYRNSMLEIFIHNYAEFGNCFLKGQYFYFTKKKITSVSIKNFIQFFKSASKDKQQIILNNLWKRIDNISRYSNEGNYDDLPF